MPHCPVFEILDGDRGPGTIDVCEIILIVPCPHCGRVCGNELIGGTVKQGCDVNVSLEDGDQKVLGLIKGRDVEAPG